MACIRRTSSATLACGLFVPAFVPIEMSLCTSESLAAASTTYVPRRASLKLTVTRTAELASSSLPLRSRTKMIFQRKRPSQAAGPLFITPILYPWLSHRWRCCALSETMSSKLLLPQA